jgi:hypothetical protein
VSASPIEQLLSAIDRLDVDGVMGLAATDVSLLTVDGRRARGPEAVRELMESVLGSLRSTSHRITDQWHTDGVWIAEVEADYELRDWLELKALPRVFILRSGENGITDVRVYGAHELPLSDHRTDTGLYIGDRWIPPL